MYYSGPQRAFQCEKEAPGETGGFRQPLALLDSQGCLHPWNHY
jgi:hypothetical protein